MKTVIITGTSRGLGKSIALKFLESGRWRVYGLSRTPSRITHEYYIEKKTDIRNIESIRNSLEGVQSADLLVNNAAIYCRSALQKMEWNTIENTLTTNILGSIGVTYFVLPLLVENSKIINISSVAATHPIKYESIYSASKTALDGFFNSIELELREKNIFVTTLYPGGIDTTLWNTSNPYPGNTNLLLSPEYISKLVMDVAESDTSVVVKKIVLYPSIEHH